MIRGMTGYGNIQVSFGKIKGILEIKSQNHRYLDIVFYLPLGFSSLEEKIRQIISKNLERGRITVSFKILDKALAELSFNKFAVREYLKYAKIAEKEYGLKNNLTLADLIKLPGVVEAKEVVINPEDLWPILEKCLRRALSSLVNMRKREGMSLKREMLGISKEMEGQIKIVQSRANAVLKEKKQTVSLEEFSSFQKSSDISEEIVRLIHYIDEFKDTLRSTSGVGKKMDFVAQEMQRETNTMGAKLQDKIVTNAVISLKSKIEKLREQAQNIE